MGGTGGTPNCFQDYTHGSFLKELSVGVGTTEVKTLTVVFTSGAKHTCGSKSPPGSEKSFKFIPGEKVVQLLVWDNYHTDNAGRVTGIQILTDRGRSFDHGIPAGNRGYLTTSKGKDLGSGLVTGLRVRSGGAIDAMGLDFLRVVSAATLKVMNYPKLSQLQLPIKTKELAAVVYNNSDSDPQTATLSGLPRINLLHRWTSSTHGFREGFGENISVRGPIPIVKKEGGTAMADLGRSGTWGLENDTVKQEYYNFTIAIPAGARVGATVTLVSYDINARYEGEMEVRTDNAAVWKFEFNGEYSGVTFGPVELSTHEVGTAESEKEVISGNSCGA